jgi:V/A-type H+-transporting ATPase subunit I
MKLLSVVGKNENIDSFITKYLLDSGLQPEDALKVLEKGWKLSYFPYDNKPKENLKLCKSILNKLNIPYKEDFVRTEIKDSVEKIENNLKQIEEAIKENENVIEEANQLINKVEEVNGPIHHLKNVDLELEEVYNLRYMKFRFGKISKEYYDKVQQNIKSLDALLIELEQTDNDVWIIYLTTEEFSMQVDSYFNVMKFERIWLPQEVKGTPADFIKNIDKFVETNKAKIETKKTELETLKRECQADLISYLAQLQNYERINKVKKYMVHDENGYFYIIGWMPLDELKQLIPKLVKEKDLNFTVKNHDEVASTPPTHLKNGKLFKSFETIVEMYGVPNYTELDPTIFVAITAFLMFGFMFGDVGQGLVIALIGLILKKKKSSMGPIFMAGGISSIIFGFLYGSIFGNEDILKPILISPMENINTMLISGIVFGTILILIAMILNIRNGIKNNDKTKIFFSENGVAGFVFYCTILITVVYFYLKGKLIVSKVILGIIFAIALLCILFKDSITNKIEHKKPKEKASMVERIFELIEVLLSFASNTISFVRLAAFAINHVGLCMAVYILSGLTTGAGNITITILGNILVIVLEGLIVAIQVLRLEYYELFSRFYSGDGKPYKPISSELK